MSKYVTGGWCTPHPSTHRIPKDELGSRSTLAIPSAWLTARDVVTPLSTVAEAAHTIKLYSISSASHIEGQQCTAPPNQKRHHTGMKFSWICLHQTTKKTHRTNTYKTPIQNQWCWKTRHMVQDRNMRPWQNRAKQQLTSHIKWVPMHGETEHLHYFLLETIPSRTQML